MSMKAALVELEAKIATLGEQIAEHDENIASGDAAIDALLEEENALKARINAAVTARDELRGMPIEDYLALKERYGRLCATRMQLRATIAAEPSDE